MSLDIKWSKKKVLQSYSICLLNFFTDIALCSFMWLLKYQWMIILCIINTITCKLRHIHEHNVRIYSCRCRWRWMVWSGKMVYRYSIQVADNAENHSCLCQCSIRHHKYSANGLFTSVISLKLKLKLNLIWEMNDYVLQSFVGRNQSSSKFYIHSEMCFDVELHNLDITASIPL
jgi:hypothetical protein